ncbi:MAG TPA: cytochrome c [Acidobacteriaceae bacterium]
MCRRELAGAAAAALALLLPAGCRSGAKLTPEQAEGQHLYAVRCAHCHRDNDLGLKPPPPELKGVMARGILPSGARATDDAVRKTVLTGKGNMPSFAGRFTEAQMQALIAYLRTDMPQPD